MPTLVLNTPTNPGAAVWSELGGAVQVKKHRVQLADIQVASGNIIVPFGLLGQIPAGAVVLSGAVFVTDAMAGGGVSTGDLIVQTAFATGWTLPETVGVSAGFQSPLSNFPGGSDAVYVDPTLSAFTPSVRITADVDLNTLTAFDMTAYVFYTVPADFTAP